MNTLCSSRSVAAPTQHRVPTAMTSAIIHAALVLLVVYTGAATNSTPAPVDKESLRFVNVTPPPEPPRPVTPPVRLPPPEELARVDTLPPIPVIEELPPPEPIEEARLQPVPREPEPLIEAPVIERANPVVQVGGFSSAIAATQTMAGRTVEAAGFDRADDRTSERARAGAVVGGFNSAAAARTAPGTGRAVGVTDAGFGTGTAASPGGAGRGRAVAAAGFGSGAAGTPGGRGSGRGVAAAGFDSGPSGSSGGRPPQTVKTSDFDSRDAPPTAPKAPVEARTEIPVEILSKPTPAYTEEARALKIEGEVTLDVEFDATGEVRVHQIVRGLGHGLDEMAARAVKAMRFKPARRNGDAVSVRTTVTIVFRLA